MTGRGPRDVGPGRDARGVPRDALRDSPLRRLLLLLESFDPPHDELTLTELSKRSGLPLTTTRRLPSPRRSQTDSVTASLTVVLAGSSADARRLVPAVVAAARGVSRALGAPSAQRSRRLRGGRRPVAPF